MRWFETKRNEEDDTSFKTVINKAQSLLNSFNLNLKDS